MSEIDRFRTCTVISVRHSMSQAAAAHVPDHDRGTDGRAQLRRPRREAKVATGSTAIGREYVTVVRPNDCHLIDRLHHAAQLSDRLYEAAQIVLQLFTADAMQPKITGSYAPRGWVRGHDPEIDDDETEARFRLLLRSQPSGLADLLHSMCLGRHPGVRWLGTLQKTLRALADEWGLADCRD